MPLQRTGPRSKMAGSQNRRVGRAWDALDDALDGALCPRSLDDDRKRKTDRQARQRKGVLAPLLSLSVLVVFPHARVAAQALLCGARLRAGGGREDGGSMGSCEWAQAWNLRASGRREFRLGGGRMRQTEGPGYCSVLGYLPWEVAGRRPRACLGKKGCTRTRRGRQALGMAGQKKPALNYYSGFYVLRQVKDGNTQYISAGGKMQAGPAASPTNDLSERCRTSREQRAADSSSSSSSSSSDAAPAQSPLGANLDPATKTSKKWWVPLSRTVLLFWNFQYLENFVGSR